MVLIKIDRRSIKKNPNGGSHIVTMKGIRQAFFTYEGDEVPKQYLKHFIVYQSQKYHGSPATHKLMSFKPIRIQTFKALSKDKSVFELRIEHEHQSFSTREPQPEYFFKYLDSKVECSECHAQIKKSDIDDDYIINEDGDEVFAEICPKCSAHGSFEYEFEKIQDVLKETA